MGRGQQQQRIEGGNTGSGAGGPAGGSCVSDPALLSGADKEDAPQPLTADSALHMQLDKADMSLTTAMLTAPSRPKTLPSIDNP